MTVATLDFLATAWGGALDAVDDARASARRLRVDVHGTRAERRWTSAELEELARVCGVAGWTCDLTDHAARMPVSKSSGGAPEPSTGDDRGWRERLGVSERPLARGDLLFSAAVAAIAVHSAVDSFVAPEPGTHWNDHLLRGSATLAVLALAAAMFIRACAGVRAAIAATLGALSLEGATLAFADTRAVGARGEDWTGFLLLPVGLFLI